MPIKPENRSRYPANWGEIRAAILERAGDCCERCKVRNGQIIARGAGPFAGTYQADTSEVFDADTGEYIASVRMSEYQIKNMVTIVLTIAHLGMPAHLPMLLHVTRSAEADEVFNIVGLLMPLDSEVPEWNLMMHRRALAQFKRGPAAISAPFFIPLPCGESSGSPRGAVMHEPLTVTPKQVVLTDWCLLGKPLKAAGVAAEAPTVLHVPTADEERIIATLADGIPKTAFASAEIFVATGRRASLDAVGSLLRRNGEIGTANNAVNMGRGFSWSGHASLYHLDEYPENCDPENLRALCQMHHLRHDAKHHAETARATRRERLAMADMFEGQTHGN